MEERHTELLTTKRAAEYLGVSVSTIYRMVSKGLLNPSKTPGGQRRFDRTDLEKYKQVSKSIIAPQNPAKLQHFNQGTFVHDISDERTKDYLQNEGTNEVDPRNQLNSLTGSEWLPETKSFWFQKGLGAKHPHAQIERQHPAPFSFQDIIRLIRFFTKPGHKVLDPFSGVGSTLKACSMLNRTGTGIELSEHWNSLAKRRLEYEVGKGESEKHTIITGDCIEELRKMPADTFDFMVTSPPYWYILNKKADHKVKAERIKNNLATKYSDSDKDLGNVKDYGKFLETLVKQVFVQCGRVIKPKKYMCIIVSDFRHKAHYVSFHADLIQKLNKAPINSKYYLALQGVKILAQNHKTLVPYGYPFAYVENIHHQYILIFRKMSNSRKR